MDLRKNPNEAMDRAVILAYRPKGPDDSLAITPRGLRPAGLQLKLAAQDTAEIIYINPVVPPSEIRVTITP